MNRNELITKIESNVVKIITIDGGQDIGAGIKRYISKVLITVQGGGQQTDQTFFVTDEGLKTETAYFENGREVKNFELQEPSRQARLLARLSELQKLGAVKAIDLSHLEIPYAELEVAGKRICVAELDKQLITLEAI